MSTLDWKNLPFGYQKTDYNVRCYYRNGKWGELEISSSDSINIHMAATCLHYAQEAFEGLKAYRGKDGKVRLFRWEKNYERLVSSAKGVYMAEVPKNIFHEACLKAIQLNPDSLPPYGTGAALYLRPMLIGTGAEVGVKPASEYLFMVFATPVGPYFKEGFNPVKIALVRDSDRAAPLGTGNIKVGGNYAASMRGFMKAHEQGFGSPMYLDCKERKYIDEIGAANFFGIKNNTYVTPNSTSVLPSITNMTLVELAESLGIKVERRPVPFDEIDTFEEVGACGTAAIISPIGEIADLDENKVYKFCKDGKPGPVSTMLYNKLQGIQYGEEVDTFGWTEIVEMN